MLLLELGVSEDILKECVGLAAQGTKSYIKRPEGGKTEGHSAVGG